MKMNHFGAHVTGVCSTKNVGLVRSLGAHHIVQEIPYQPEPTTVRGEPNGGELASL